MADSSEADGGNGSSTTGGSEAFMSALVTEHFVLQTASAATISESGYRSTIYLSALSSGLVAIGFASSSRSVLTVLVCTVLPTVFLLGWFTITRLVDTSVANIASLRKMRAIREYYSTLSPIAVRFFGDAASSTRQGVQYGALAPLFTSASTILVVNCVLGGATATFVGAIVLGLPFGPSLTGGIVLGIALIAAGLLYQRRRLARADEPDGS